jgi:hypothetical protein
MTSTPTHKWTFRARFRRRAFGWKSQPAIKRIKEAVAEIEKVSREDPLLAAEGAVLFLERVSPAIEHVDSSSGAIGGAVDRAIAALVGVIARAPADEDTRQGWLERLWRAYLDDEIPYLEGLGDRWGELCVSPSLASRWADELMESSRAAWGDDPERRGHFKGTTSCMSALLAAGRHEEVLELLGLAPYNMWHYRRYGVRALVAMGRGADAITLAEDRGLNDSGVAIARACEQVLLDAGLVDEAYARYGIVANRAGTNLAWFRAVMRRYPLKPATDVLADLVAHTPGEEGKWFAAAKSAKLFDEAIELATRTPCSPRTLTRAARDFEQKNPGFALEAGLAALGWLVQGYGYEITGVDVRAAYDHTMRAAEGAGVADQTRERIRDIVSQETFGDRFVTRILGGELGI